MTHVGDSRAYLLRAGGLHRLRETIHRRSRWSNSGQRAPDQSPRRSPSRADNVLGGTTEDVEVQTHRLQLKDGDCLLLCSDGLTDLVDDQMINKTCGDGPVQPCV